MHTENAFETFVLVRIQFQNNNISPTQMHLFTNTTHRTSQVYQCDVMRCVHIAVVLYATYHRYFGRLIVTFLDHVQCIGAVALSHPNTHSSSRNYCCRCRKLFVFLSFVPFYLVVIRWRLMQCCLLLKFNFTCFWVGVIDRWWFFLFILIFYFLFIFKNPMKSYGTIHTGIASKNPYVCIRLIKSLIELELNSVLHNMLREHVSIFKESSSPNVAV